MTNRSSGMITDTSLPELTLRGMILGALITLIFTASNVYLGLKVGMTFSSSIPAAVISMAVLRMCRNSNVLENNMVQTQASSAGTLSAIIFILPGLIMLGYWNGFPMLTTLTLCSLGGVLGVLFTIPLRRAMVVDSDLPYPEGRAAAEILKVGSESRKENRKEGDTHASGLKEIVMGSALAGVFSFCASGLHIFTSGLSMPLQFGRQAFSQMGMSFSMALISAGYLIGLGSGIAILVGTGLTWFGFVPYLTSVAEMPEGVDAMDFAVTVWVTKVRYVGAGCIGIAALWTLLSLSKAVMRGVKESIASIRMNDTSEKRALHHTDIDMSPKSIGLVFLICFIGLFMVFYGFVAEENLSLGVTLAFVLAGLVVAVVVGFLVAAACAYMAGLLGSSSSPISGIAIIAVIIASLVIFGFSTAFDVFEIEGGTKFSTALAIFTTSVVLAIAAISNDNMQDLKTGYLVGATPWRQQVALIIGCVAGAIAIAPVLNLLYQAYGFTGALPRPDMDPTQALSAPQATLMTAIAQGIFNSSLEWDFILMGVGLGAVCIVIDRVLKGMNRGWMLPPLAVGFGIYLPIGLNVPLIVGAVLGYIVNRHLKRQAAARDPEHAEQAYQDDSQRGVLFASGMIVGESMVGVIIALLIVLSITAGGSADPLSLADTALGGMANVLGTVAFIAVIAVFVYRALNLKKN